jgi:hypothetical protein
MRRNGRAWLGRGALLLVLSGCAPSSVSGVAPSHSPSALVSGSPAPQRAPVPSVTGFGALNADWEAHHTPASVCKAGACYNLDPNLPQVNGHIGTRYFGVDHANGRVTIYQMALSPKTPIASAKAQALQEFPSDAKAVWYQVMDTCSQMEVRSAILGSALGNPTVGDAAGYASVDFSTIAPDGSSGYTASNINFIILTLGSYLTPSDSPGC